MKPTKGYKTITLPNGLHKKVQTNSYAVLMTQIGGSRVKAVRLDNQVSKVMAVKTAQEDNPGWRFKAIAYLNDRDFEEGEENR